MNSTLLEDGLNALRTRGFAGEREGDIRLISLRRLTREQLERVFMVVESVGARVGVSAEVSGIGYGCTTVVVRLKPSSDPARAREQVDLLFSAFAKATTLRDCDIQIIVGNANGRREDLRHIQIEMDGDAMDLVALGQAITSAVSIVRNLPGAIETAKKVRFDLDKADEITTLGLSGQVGDGDPLSILVDGLLSEIRQLSADYLKNSQSWSVPERQAYQRRVASKATELLSVAKPILATRTPSYSVLVEFFNGAANQGKPVP